MGEIISIVYKPKGTRGTPEQYVRVPTEEAELVVGKGIKGDAKGSPSRQLNIMFEDTVSALKEEGYLTGPGQLGEQIIVRGIDSSTLQAGDKLLFGDSAVIEVIKPRTGCDRFELAQKHPKENTVGRLGVIAKVVQGGVIRVGDRVRLPEAAPNV